MMTPKERAAHTLGDVFEDLVLGCSRRIHEQCFGDLSGLALERRVPAAAIARREEVNAPSEIVNRDAEKWRRPLIAFYERDGMPQRAMNLKNGAALEYSDHRTIRALEAAVICAMVNA